MSKVRLLALDLDGTAVDDRGRLGEKTKAALLRARRAGHVVGFVTGRRDIDMVPLADPDRYADYLVLNNGGKIVRTADGAVLQNILTEEADSKKLIEFCLAKNYLLHVICGMYWGVNKMTPGTVDYAHELGMEPVMYHAVRDLPGTAVEGFMATAEGDRVGAYIDREHLALDYVQSEPTCIDIMKTGISKWGGTNTLCRMLGISAADVISAGNYNNDIDLLKNAGVGVAVRNALDCVKAAADYVTEADNNHDAVAEIVEKFLEL